MTARFAKGGYRFFGDRHWNEPRRWNRKAERDGVRRRVFPSMCDPFDRNPDLGAVPTRFRELVEQTPHLDWLLLTKRPQNIGLWAPLQWVEEGFPPNIWLGVTAETQQRADERLCYILTLPVKVAFVSCEPLLEQLDLGPYLEGEWGESEEGHIGGRRLDWVITGAESGRKRRPMQEEWVKQLRDQCVAANVPFFYKQRAESKRMVSMPYLGGRQWMEVPE
jgi:protein gp37